jgi:acetylornithine deacetylase/succinyl-diaminopimelate desuccinylase-like protein
MAADIDWAPINAEALGYFRDLLRFDTTNPPGNEQPAAEYLGRVLSREGIPYEIVESASRRANLVARLKSTGARPPLLLNAHLDVVPVDPEHWSHPPFDAVEADGYMWGRGAIDMKNMAAMSFMTLLLLKRQGVSLERDVIFAAVADEEAGSEKGSLFLVENHPELVRSEYVLGEVGGHTLHFGAQRFYPVQVSEKGICWFEITAEGEPGHGSMPHPKNAVVRLARAIESLADARLPQHNTPVVENFLRSISSAAPFPQRRLLPLLLNPKLGARLLDLLATKNPRQAAGINAMLRNTATPTMLAAGKKVNVIPSAASATIDGRVIPGQSVDRFLEEVRSVIGDDLHLKVQSQHQGATFSSDTLLFEAIARVIARHDPGAIVVPYMIPGFTDAFAYARLGATCYGFSPVRLGPNLDFARLYHGHDERIPVDGFTWGLRVLYELVSDFCCKT